MKKSFASSLLSLLFLSLYSCSDKPNQLEVDNLKGNVLKTKVTRYEATEKFGEIEALDEIESVYIDTYDENGYYASKIEYAEDGDEISKHVYTLEDGKLTELKIYHLGELRQKQKNTFKDGKITKWSLWLNDTKTTYEVTYDGDKISKEEYDKDGKKGIITYTHFDDYGSYDRIEEFDGKETLTEVRINSYHRLLSYKNSNYSETCEYDENGDLVKKKIEYLQYGEVSSTTDTKYVYTQYDDNENWIERNVYEDDKLKYVEKREITYNEDSSILNVFS